MSRKIRHQLNQYDHQLRGRPSQEHTSSGNQQERSLAALSFDRSSFGLPAVLQLDSLFSFTELSLECEQLLAASA
jgi:hypothetical protein